ncbi:MAG TPA: DUF4835 family protein [Balneolales bacterium]|nr:DUF4835 family protein [Balneolales bacterium]
MKTLLNKAWTMYHMGFTKAIIIGMFALLFFPLLSFAQELKCDVTIDKSKISSSNIDYIGQLKSAIEDYINNHNWTDDRFQDEERIHFNMQVILNSVDNNYNFKANVVISSERPIYNTVSTTPVVIISDNWDFNYTPNSSVVHDEFQFNDVASFLDFYSYIILGYDYDTFSRLGGSPYFKKARKIVDIAQSAGGSGWSSSSGPRSRYSLVSDLLDPNYEDLRKAIYIYHRQGLDLFTSNTEKARSNVADALKLIQNAQNKTTDNYLFDLFFNTKFREIVSIFQDAPQSQRLDVYNLLTTIDSGHISEYDKLKK